jgi:DNA-binding transcriptional LysR family regulator
MVNLELYRVFYTVAKCGSLTKAADELYISQPAVSQSIKQLESQLGISLFNRTHRGMELSAQGGKVIFHKIEQALSLFGEAETMIAQINTSATGTIRIGASDTIFEYVLAEKIVEFHEKYPAVKIELLAEYSPKTIEELKNNLCDVAFVNLPIEVDPALRLYGNFKRLSDVFITGNKYPELLDRTVTVADLKKYPLITLDKGTVATKSLKAFLSSIGVEMKASIEVSSWELMKCLVSRGMGVGVIPREYVKKELEEAALYEIKTDPVMSVRSVGMVLPKHSPVPYALRMFLEMFDVKV